MLPSAGSHPVKVDGINYRYMVSESCVAPDGTVSVAVTVQVRNGNGAYLRVLGLTAIPVPVVVSESRKERRRNQAIKPHHVARSIRLGLVHGWNPGLPGPPAILQVSNSDVAFENRTA